MTPRMVPPKKVPPLAAPRALRALRGGGPPQIAAPPLRGGLRSLFLIVASLVLACRGNATRDDCAKMMDRYVDLAIAEEPALAKLPPGEAATVREMKRELKLGEKSFKKVHDRCEIEITRGEVSCALGAATSKEWEACIK